MVLVRAAMSASLAVRRLKYSTTFSNRVVFASIRLVTYALLSAVSYTRLEKASCIPMDL